MTSDAIVALSFSHDRRPVYSAFPPSRHKWITRKVDATRPAGAMFIRLGDWIIFRFQNNSGLHNDCIAEQTTTLHQLLESKCVGRVQGRGAVGGNERCA